MCVYCAYDHTFWDSIIEGAKRITILTPDEVEELYRLNPQLRPGQEADK